MTGMSVYTSKAIAIHMRKRVVAGRGSRVARKGVGLAIDIYEGADVRE